MKISIAELHEHPENQLFHDLPNEDLQALADDMQANGMIHAVVARKIDSGYQIISGHQRVRAAKELGWQEIEATAVEADDNQAVRMLIAANIKTRTLSPMELAKAIRREKELIEHTYGNRERKRTDLTADHNDPQLQGRWSEQVSQEIGKSEPQIRRLDKLNELIPELQHLVDANKLGTTAAEQLAYLEPDDQQALYAAFGESIAEQSVSETKEIRRQIDAERQAREVANERVEQLQREIEKMNQQQTDTAALEESLAQAQKALADRPTVEVVSEGIKATIEEMRSQNEALKSQLSKSEYNIERLKREKSEALEAKRIAESREIEKRNEHARLLKTLESAGQHDEHFRMMQAFTAKLIDLRKEAGGMVEAWDAEQVSDETLTIFGNTLQNTIESLQKLQQKKKGGAGNVVMLRKG